MTILSMSISGGGEGEAKIIQVEVPDTPYTQKYRRVDEGLVVAALGELESDGGDGVETVEQN